MYFRNRIKKQLVPLLATVLFLTYPLFSQWAVKYDGGYTCASGFIAPAPEGGFILPCLSRVIKISPEGNIDWQYGFPATDIYSICTDSEQGYLAAGSTWGVYGKTSDIVLLKLSRWGELEWHKVYRSNDLFNNELINCIRPLTEGGYIAAGYIGEYKGWSSERTLLVVKFTSSGEVEWTLGLDYATFDEARFIRRTADNGFIVGGKTGDWQDSDRDIWLIKLTATGAVEWQYLYGGDWKEDISSVEQTADGGYITAGFEMSFPGKSGAWILKLDHNGGIEWQRSFRGSTSMRAHWIEQTADGEYIAAGTSFNEEKNLAGWILKLSATGDIAWQRKLTGKTSGGAYSIRDLGDESYVVCAGIEGQEWWRDHYNKVERPLIMKLDPDGEISDSCNLIGDIEISLFVTEAAVQVPLGVNISTPGLVEEENTITQRAETGKMQVLCGSAQTKDFYPPSEFAGERRVNQSWLILEQVNFLTWQNNPENTRQLKHRIYQLKNGTRIMLAEVPAGVSYFMHRKTVKSQDYKYIITAVDNQGRESYPAFTIVYGQY